MDHVLGLRVNPRLPVCVCVPWATVVLIQVQRLS